MGRLKNFLNILENEIKSLRNLFHYSIYRRYINFETEKRIVEQFHKIYYDAFFFGKTWADTTWLGIPTRKCPLDLWVYQEILFEKKPDVIIECGTAKGGSALFLASVCDILNRGKVITIDVKYERGRPKHRRIKYLLGSSTSTEVVRRVRNLIKEGDEVMVILDSDHHKEHVLNELRIYSSFVSKGNYIIVEDTNLNNHPVRPDFGPGPMEAVKEFLKENKNFIIDKSREKFYLTFNPNGYLKRVK